MGLDAAAIARRSLGRAIWRVDTVDGADQTAPP
jgi:hypothetical protein